MDDLLSEKEQIEKMRTWWSDYGNYVIAGVVLGALALFGYNRFENSRIEAEEQASALYDALSIHIDDGDLDEAEAVARELQLDYVDSAYASQGKLALARLYMDNARDQDAADTLNALLDSNTSDAFKHVARVRLAKVMLYQDRAEEVVDILAAQGDEGAFAARYSDTLGDAYVMLGRHSDARAAFQRALAEPQQAASVDQQYVQFKLLDLPEEAFESTGTSDDELDNASANASDNASDDVTDIVDIVDEADEAGEVE